MLESAVAAEGAEFTREGDGRYTVTGLEPRRIAELARRNGVLLEELTPVSASLEEAFMELTAGETEYGTGPRAAGAAGADRAGDVR